MKPTPKGWPRLSVALFYKDGAKAIDWLCNAFGFEVRLRVDGEGGRIEHSELLYGEAVIMVGDESAQKAKDRPNVSPRSAGGANTAGVMLYVDDVDAVCERARKAGAKITYEPQVSDYGDNYWADRNCEVEDLEGHRWWFCQRMRG